MTAAATGTCANPPPSLQAKSHTVALSINQAVSDAAGSCKTDAPIDCTPAHSRLWQTPSAAVLPQGMHKQPGANNQVHVQQNPTEAKTVVAVHSPHSCTSLSKQPLIPNSWPMQSKPSKRSPQLLLNGQHTAAQQ